MKVHLIKLLIIIFSVSLMLSCTDENNPQLNQGGGPGLYFDMTRASQDIINNTQVYMFDGQGADIGEFNKKLIGITYGTNSISMKVESGTWDFALVSAEEDIKSDLISPVRGNQRSTPMWTMVPTGGELKSMPELRMGYLAGQQITANQNNTGGPLDLYRNVAKVRVYIEEANGLDPAGTSTMELKGVPTTINWEGKLMPDKVNPTVSTSPMKGNFTLTTHPNKTGYHQSEPLEFIIPAHRGTDFLNAAPADTTEQHLTLTVDLACLGGTRNKKEDIIISKVPRMNGILEVRLFAGGEVKVTADILSWEDKNINTGISNTVLETDKATVGLAHKDTIYVNTNAATFTVEKDPAASWLTVQRIGNTNAIEITAEVNTYVDNSPRDSYFTIQANNLTKKIPVTQRPDRGTISVDTKQLFLSPPHPTKSLNVTSIGGDWQIIGSTLKATPNKNNDVEGTTSVSFTRESINDEDYYSRVYGDTIIVFKNKITLDTDTVRISNLFIGIEDDEIMVAQPTLSSDTTCVVNNVIVYGGDYKGLTVVSKPDWIWPAPHTYYDVSTNQFYFRCDREPSGEPRWDDITLQHTDDPDYRVTVRVVQDIIVDIPEFDFYSVTFTWGSAGDVDIKCGFVDNSGNYTFSNGTTSFVTVPFDDKYVGFNNSASGFNFSSTVTYNSKTLIQWGGDEQNGGKGETFFFNAPVIDSNPYPEQYGVTPATANVLPRKLKLTISAGWWSFPSGKTSAPITCEVAAYRGGTYQLDGKAYVFTGERVYGETKTYMVSEKPNGSPREYFDFCTIVYDRKKHTGNPTWNQSRQPVTGSVPTSVTPENNGTYIEEKKEVKTPIKNNEDYEAKK